MAIIKVKTGGITADAVTDALIADDVVGTEHLTANEVDTTALGADAVTGAQLADDAVNSEHYTDGSIDTAHIADSNVTGAKLNTDVISAQTALTSAPDDTDEFLVSDAGTLKRIDYSLIKGGGAFEHLLTTSASNSANIVFSSTYITTTYLDYKLIFSGIKAASDGYYPQLDMSTDNGSSYTDFQYRIIRQSMRDNANSANSGSGTSASAFLIGSTTGGNASNEKAFSGFVDIYDPLKQSGTTDSYTLGQAHTVYMDTAGKLVTNEVGFAASTTTAINNIKFSMSTGNITSGKVSLYGRKIS